MNPQRQQQQHETFSPWNATGGRTAAAAAAPPRVFRPVVPPQPQAQAHVAAAPPSGREYRPRGLSPPPPAFDLSREVIKAMEEPAPPRPPPQLLDHQFHQSWPRPLQQPPNQPQHPPSQQQQQQLFWPSGSRYQQPPQQQPQQWIVQSQRTAQPQPQEQPQVAQPPPPPQEQAQLHQSWPQPVLLQQQPAEEQTIRQQHQEDTTAADKLMQLKKEHAQLQTAKSQLEKDLASTQTQLHKSQSQLEKSQSQLRDTQTQLEKSQSHLHSSHSDLQALQSELQAITQDEDQLEHALHFIEELKQARDEAVTHRQVTGDKLRKLRVDNEELKDSNRALQEELREARHTIRELEVAGSGEQRQAVGTSSDPAALLLKAQEDANNQMQKNFVASQSAQSMLQEQLQQAGAKLANVHVQLDQAKARVVELEGTNSTLEREKEQRVRELQAKTSRLEDQERQLEKSKAQNANLQRAYERNTKELESDIDRLAREHAQQLLALKTEQGGLAQKHEAELSALEAKLRKEHEEQLERERNTVKNLQQKLRALGDQQDQLQERLQSLQAERDTMKADLDSSQSLAATTDHQLQEALDTLGELEAKLQVVTLFFKAREAASSKPGATGARGLTSSGDELEIDAVLLRELAKAKTASAKTKGELQTVIEHNLSELKAVHASMQGGIQEANNEIEALEAGMDDMETLQREFANLEASHEATVQQKQTLDRQLNDAHDRLYTANDKVKKLAGDMEKLQRDLLGTQSERDGLQDKLGSVSNELAETQADLTASRKAKEKLEHDLAAANKENEALQSTNLKVKAERINVQATCDETRAELEEARYEAGKLQGVADRDRKKISKLEGQLSESRDDVEDLANKVDAMQRKHSKELAELKAERDNLQASLDKLEEEHNSMEASRKRSTALIDEYSAKTEELEAVRSKLEGQREAWASKEAALIEVIAELQDSAAETERDVRQSYETLRSDMAAHRQEKEAAVQARERLSKELKDAQQAMEALSKGNEGLLEQQLDANQQLEKLQWEVRTKKKENETLKGQASHLEDLESQANSELEKIRAELGAKKKENSSLKAQVSRLEDLEREANHDLNNTRETLGAKRKEIDSLREEVSQKEASQSKAERELEEVRLELVDARKENDSLKAQSSRLQAQHEKARETIRQMDEEKMAATSASRDLPQPFEEHNAEVKSLQRSLSESRMELENLEDRYQDLSKAHQGMVKASRDAAVALSQQLDERNTELNNLGKKFRKTHKENVAMKEKLRRMEDQKQKEESGLEQANQKLKDALRELNDLRPARERAMLELEDAAALRDTAQESLKSAEAMIESLRDRHRTESQAKNEKIAQLTKDLLLAEKTSRGHERRFDETRSKLRQAALDKQKLHKDHAAEVESLKGRVSHLESRLDATRKACSELETSKDKVDSQLKYTEAKVASLQDALATSRNDFRNRDRDSQNAYQDLMSRARKLEEELPRVTLEREMTKKEAEHLRGKLRKALSDNSALEASFKQAESDLATVIRALAEAINLVSKTDTYQPRNAHPMDLVANVKAALRNAMEGREEALKSRKVLEEALIDSKALAARLGSVVKEKDEKLSELKSDFDREKRRLKSELNSLEAAVEHGADENKKLVTQLRSKLRQAEDEGRALNSELGNAKKDKDLLSRENKSMQQSLKDAAATVAKLKDKAENQSRADKDYGALRSMNGTLQKVLDKAMSATKEVHSSAQVDPDAGERSLALESALADAEEEVKQLLDQLQQVDEEKQVLHSEAVKLKWFVDEFLHEAGHLVVILRDSLEDSEPETSRHGPDSPTRSVLARLEKLVDHMEAAGVDVNKQHPKNGTLPQGKHRKESLRPPSSDRSKRSTPRIPRRELSDMEDKGLHDDEKKEASSHGRQFQSDRNDSLQLSIKAQDMDQAAYVQQRLAKSAAAKGPRVSPAVAKRHQDRLFNQGRVVENLRLYNSTTPTFQRGGQHEVYDKSNLLFMPTRGLGTMRPGSFAPTTRDPMLPLEYSDHYRPVSRSPSPTQYRKGGEPGGATRVSSKIVSDDPRFIGLKRGMDVSGSFDDAVEDGGSRLNRARWGALA